MNVCAVLGCEAEGKVHECPYDGSLHRHGRIHYDCGYPVSRLEFRDGWHLICDEHYAVCCQERREVVLLNSMVRA